MWEEALPKSQMLAAVMLLTGASAAIAAPLHNAARDGDLEQVKALLAEGADVHATELNLGTPLHMAAFKGFIEIAELLVC